MPFDRSKYPSGWQAIRQRIQKRAGDKCEKCGVLNHAIGYREKDGAFVQLARSRETAGLEIEAAALCDGLKVIEIVCTTAHVHDPDPHNVADHNLAFLCQRCHNRLDAPMRAKNAAATRAQKRKQQEAAAGVLALEIA